MKSLQYLVFLGPQNFEKFPEISEVMNMLSELYLGGTAIEELPASVLNLTNLVTLRLNDCRELESLPSSICHMKSLQYLDENEMRIPNKFFRKYGDDLSNPVFIKLPTGSEIWEGEVWFGEGWPKFSKFYSLDCCHSLVFGYEGNSTFRICIFDKDFAEITIH
ncbi:hypothetical protein DVH24_031304 [Malus domestica]|uniref:Disease resistance protein RPS4B/Roq1-like leucine-rich repeats domain-containing protein n=1 Tax=Malus domestica TaxID=3750 RepID=A0A498HIL8_MALDO|nr:hypothetical protein DVH24_031304 [Malus domestica]